MAKGEGGTLASKLLSSINKKWTKRKKKNP